MRGIGLVLGRRGLLVAVAVVASLGLASAASAATFNVNDTRDFAQSSTATSGTCVSTASTCTLRAAVQAANQNGGANTINLPAGTYLIGTPTSNSTANCYGLHGDQTTGEFKINPCNNSTSVTIVGAGEGTTVINAQNNDRVFDLFPNGVLDLQKMTVENGSPGNSSHTRSEPNGGAVYSSGHLSAEAVTFTGNTATTSDDGGAIYADSSAGSTLSASGDVFQNNSADDGGAVYTDSPNDLSLSFSLFQANNASYAGGAFYGSSNAAGLTLNFDDLVQNVAVDYGGAINWHGGGALNISSSLFNQNQVTSTGTSDGDGGAISNVGSANFNVSNSSFDGNTAGYNGGAIVDAGSNALNITEVKFSGNTAGHYAGALEVHDPPATLATITSSEFDGNSATTDGGAIAWRDATLALAGVSFVLNTTSGNGGALWDDSYFTTPGPVYHYLPLVMEDSTMSRNTASSGGGIYNDSVSTPLTMINDTIAFNNAGSTSGGGVYDASEFTSGGSSTSGFGVENTTIAENSGGDCDTSDTFQKSVDTGNNNDSDQLCFGGLGGPNDKTGVNPLLGNPANNGGPAAGGPGDTETIQTDAEQASSPTVDAGNNNGCPVVDERGIKRPQGAACDIGAFEFGVSTTTTTGVTSTSTSVTSTSTSHTTSTPCPKGQHKSGGRCVKNKKPKHKHKKKCPKGKVRKGKKCVKKGKKK